MFLLEISIVQHVLILGRHIPMFCLAPPHLIQVQKYPLASTLDMLLNFG